MQCHAIKIVQKLSIYNRFKNDNSNQIKALQYWYGTVHRALQYRYQYQQSKWWNDVQQYSTVF